MTLRKRWCSTLWPTPAGRNRPAWRSTEFAAFVRGALFLDRPDPVARVARAARLPGRADRALSRERARSASRPRAPTCGSPSSGRTWVNSDGKRNMPSGEVFTGPLESSAEGHVRFTIRSVAAPASTSTESSSSSAAARSSRRARGRRRLPPARARDRRRRAASGRDRDRHELRDRPPDRRDPVRREDRRDGPPRARALLPRDRRPNECALHWDLICDLRDGGRLVADGETVLEDGRFAHVA